MWLQWVHGFIETETKRINRIRIEIIKYVKLQTEMLSKQIQRNACRPKCWAYIRSGILRLCY